MAFYDQLSRGYLFQQCDGFELGGFPFFHHYIGLGLGNVGGYTFKGYSVRTIGQATQFVVAFAVGQCYGIETGRELVLIVKRTDIKKQEA